MIMNNTMTIIQQPYLSLYFLHNDFQYSISSWAEENFFENSSAIIICQLQATC